MTSGDARDVGAERLDQLMVLTPDPVRAELVRVKCRTQLARRQQRAARLDLFREFTWRALAPIVVAAFCVLYAVALMATTLRLEGVVK
jgi:hypothetical protein